MLIWGGSETLILAKEAAVGAVTLVCLRERMGWRTSDEMDALNLGDDEGGLVDLNDDVGDVCTARSDWDSSLRLDKWSEG